MDWKVIFSLRSQQDLRRIVERIAGDDPAATERFGFALIAKAESLANTPDMGVPMRERPGTRFFPHGSYLIIYRPDPAKQTVRILHQSPATKLQPRCRTTRTVHPSPPPRPPAVPA